MRDYLHSLERMRALPNLSVIFGGHGPAIANPYAKIDEYISHRLDREQKILEAVREGASTPKEIVARVYTDVPQRRTRWPNVRCWPTWRNLKRMGQ